MDRRLTVLLAALLACNGVIEEPGRIGGDPAGPGAQGPGEIPTVPPGVDPLTHLAGLGPMGLSRLSREELRRTHLDLLGSDPGVDLELLPEDAITPFDNDSSTQQPSAALVEGLASIAARAATRVLADRAARDRIVGCSPAGPGDETCFRSFVTSFGRRALRRPLEVSEIDELVTMQRFAVSEGDFYVGVELAMRVLLQDIEHVYRVEIGTPAMDGAVRLAPFELASRLSYFLWGSMPDDALLDAALSGGLNDTAGVRTAATRMVADPRSAERLARFHALWLGYETLPHSAERAASMRSETDALVRRVVLEDQRSWLELFTSTESYVDDTMAEIYGMPATGRVEWRDLNETGRKGILSHSSFLSGGGKFGDTSPVLRGLFVRERLLCQPVPPPPPTVNADDPPPEHLAGACKEDRYAAHRENAECAGCHARMDPVGFGLENYDREGRYREHDEGRPECVISGQGELPDLGMSFVGPAGLSDVLVETGRLDDCMLEHLFQFVVGRAPTSLDDATVASLVQRFEAGEARLDALLVELVASEAFRHRVIEAEGDAP